MNIPLALSHLAHARGYGYRYIGDPDRITEQDYARVRWFEDRACTTPLPTDKIPAWEEISALARSLATTRLWTDLRQRRNTLLTESDWTQMSDSPLRTEGRARWAAYRQSLRDLPASTTDPASPTWPTPPA